MGNTEYRCRFIYCLTLLSRTEEEEEEARQQQQIYTSVAVKYLDELRPIYLI